MVGKLARQVFAESFNDLNAATSLISLGLFVGGLVAAIANYGVGWAAAGVGWALAVLFFVHSYRLRKAIANGDAMTAEEWDRRAVEAVDRRNALAEARKRRQELGHCVSEESEVPLGQRVATIARMGTIADLLGTAGMDGEAERFRSAADRLPPRDRDRSDEAWTTWLAAAHEPCSEAMSVLDAALPD